MIPPLPAGGGLFDGEGALGVSVVFPFSQRSDKFSPTRVMLGSTGYHKALIFTVTLR